jgi:ribosomal protein S18 acetylase RimI-like enzyme
MSDFEVRQAQGEDFLAVAQIHYPVWIDSNNGVMTPFVLNWFDPPEIWPESKYRPTLSTPGWQMWIAESDGNPLGMTIFGPDPENTDLIELDSLYVATKDQGIGTSLLAKVLASHPSHDVVLWCSEKNQRARDYYEGEKRGFKLDGRTKIWEPFSGVQVPQVGYRLYRSTDAP